MGSVHGPRGLVQMALEELGDLIPSIVCVESPKGRHCRARQFKGSLFSLLCEDTGRPRGFLGTEQPLPSFGDRRSLVKPDQAAVTGPTAPRGKACV